MMYADDESYAKLKSEGKDFTPMFVPDYKDDEQEAKADELCSDNLQCKFDFVATGDENVAKGTLDNANAIEDANAKLGQ